MTTDEPIKAVLTLNGDIAYEFDNLTIGKFMMTGQKPSDESPMTMEHFTIGKPITLITSNMPDELKTQIGDLISKYCNH